GRNLQRFEPLEQLVIDEVSPLELGIVEAEPRINHSRQPAGHDVRLVADDQIGLAAPKLIYAPLCRHGGHCVVIDTERGEASHVALVAVSVLGKNAKLLWAGLPLDRRAGLDVELDDGSVTFSQVFRRSVADPRE